MAVSSGSRCTAGAVSERPCDITRSALRTAACSNESSGLLTEIPSPVGVPATGPERCCTTWVSSWASVCRPASLSSNGAVAPSTTSLPTVYAWACTLAADSCAADPVWTRTSPKSLPNRCSMSVRRPSGSGEPPEPTTSRTGDCSSIAPTPALPAVRCRRSSAAGLSALASCAATLRCVNKDSASGATGFVDRASASTFRSCSCPRMAGPPGSVSYPRLANRTAGREGGAGREGCIRPARTGTRRCSAAGPDDWGTGHCSSFTTNGSSLTAGDQPETHRAVYRQFLVIHSAVSESLVTRQGVKSLDIERPTTREETNGAPLQQGLASNATRRNLRVGRVGRCVPRPGVARSRIPRCPRTRRAPGPRGWSPLIDQPRRTARARAVRRGLVSNLANPKMLVFSPLSCRSSGLASGTCSLWVLCSAPLPLRGWG